MKNHRVHSLKAIFDNRSFYRFSFIRKRLTLPVTQIWLEDWNYCLIQKQKKKKKNVKFNLICSSWSLLTLNYITSAWDPFACVCWGSNWDRSQVCNLITMSNTSSKNLIRYWINFGKVLAVRDCLNIPVSLEENHSLCNKLEMSSNISVHAMET